MSGADSDDYWRRWAIPLSLLVVGGVIAGAAAFGPRTPSGEHGAQISGSPLVAPTPAAEVTPAAPMSIAAMPAAHQAPSGPGAATPTPAPQDPPAPQPAPLTAPASPSPPPLPLARHTTLDPNILDPNILDPNTASGRADTPAPLAPCPDQVIAVQTQTGTPSYPVGQHSQFRLLITNIGPAACTRDLDPGLRELIVTTATNGRIWSDRDCTAVHYPDLRTLQPSVPAGFELRWSGLTSNPHCAGTRTRAGAGAYQLIGRLGGRFSTPTAFTLMG